MKITTMIVRPDAAPTDVRTLDPDRCQHAILVAEHYRHDGSCRCNDPSDRHMRSWGYVWKDDLKLWEVG